MGNKTLAMKRKDNNISVSWVLDTTPLQGHDRWQSDVDMGHRATAALRAGMITVIGGTQSAAGWPLIGPQIRVGG